MNKPEFMKIAMAIKTYYPSGNLFPNAEAIQLWYEEFKDLTYEDTVNGLRRHVNTSKWPPTIAELKRAIITNVAGNKDWGKCWDEAVTVLKRFGYYQEDAALDAMTPITRQIVKRLGYKELCLSENLSHDRANFRMIFEQITDNEYENAALPHDLQEKINSALEEKEEPKLIGDIPNATNYFKMY